MLRKQPLTRRTFMGLCLSLMTSFLSAFTGEIKRLKKIPFKSLYLSDLGWLQSRFHFSFADYYNPKNEQYGVLRVMNDDIVAPQSGFDRHPHKDMEIVTYVIDGELTHKNYIMSIEDTLSAGDMQYMSAGKGIEHSEMNHSTLPVRFLQIWINPDKKNLIPKYGSKSFDQKDKHNKWLHIISPTNGNGTVTISQDANIYVSKLDKFKKLTFDVKRDRQCYFKLISGEAEINQNIFSHGDAAEFEMQNLNIMAKEDAHLLIVEMKRT